MSVFIWQPEVGVKYFSFPMSGAEDTVLHIIIALLHISLCDQGWCLKKAKIKKVTLEIEWENEIAWICVGALASLVFVPIKRTYSSRRQGFWWIKNEVLMQVWTSRYLDDLNQHHSGNLWWEVSIYSSYEISPSVSVIKNQISGQQWESWETDGYLPFRISVKYFDICHINTKPTSSLGFVVGCS